MLYRVSSKTCYDAVLTEDLDATSFAEAHIFINGQNVDGLIYAGNLFTEGQIASGTHILAIFDPQHRKFYITGSPCFPTQA
jgi:hypothetical protein